MSGKKKMGAGWGGKRAGSGRKSRFGITETEVNKMLKDAKKWAKQEGCSLNDVVLEIAYRSPDNRERLAAVKIYKEYTMTKKTETESHNYQHNEPVVILPASDPDPALQVVQGGKK